MKNVIEVKNLRKEFKSYSSRTGLKGAFRELGGRRGVRPRRPGAGGALWLRLVRVGFLGV